MEPQNSLTIGEAARRGGLGVETLRYYERRGLIEEPPRKRSGYRQYPLEVVRRLHFILRAKELGFTLEEIVELLSLHPDPSTPCADVAQQIETKTRDIESRIADLERIRLALRDLKRACDEAK